MFQNNAKIIVIIVVRTENLKDISQKIKKIISQND